MLIVMPMHQDLIQPGFLTRDPTAGSVLVSRVRWCVRLASLILLVAVFACPISGPGQGIEVGASTVSAELSR